MDEQRRLRFAAGRTAISRILNCAARDYPSTKSERAGFVGANESGAPAAGGVHPRI